MKNLAAIFLALAITTGCEQGVSVKAPDPIVNLQKQAAFSFDVNPGTFELVVEKEGVKASVSEPLPKRKVSNLQKDEHRVSWNYPDDQMKIDIEQKGDYLQVQLESTGAESFTWPTVSGTSYMLPLGEGKWIPSADKDWQAFLKDESLTFAESFSMRFFAVNKRKYAALYIADKLFNDTVDFATEPAISLSFTHEFPTVNPKKSYSFRLYVTDNDPVSIASVYKNYVKEKGEYKTLAHKAAANPNVEKLYGAPHFYLWNKSFLGEDDLKWGQLKNRVQGAFLDWMTKLLQQNGEDGKESIQQLQDIQKQDYVDAYQKKALLNGFNYVLRSRDFYSPQIFPRLDEQAKALVGKGVAQLNEPELYELNKRLLKSVLQETATEVEQWGATDSTKLLNKLQGAGISHAWIGLADWTAAYMKPEYVKQAGEMGYLIASYDSYHSIHKEENQEWNTAIFPDKTLYENATITKKNGEKKAGYLGEGRLLNPTLSLPSVKARMDEIMGTGVAFNSWFIDVDAAGDFNDDYTPGRTTTQEQDMQAKLARMDYIRDEKQLVIGSETGNDFASQTIAFAHGIETPVIKWADPDMRENKTSPYYVGGYWSPAGEIPQRYSKQVPIKEVYRHVYIDPAYSLPLFKLVYNDSVITTHHWEWDSLKIKGEVGTRMLSELLYNVPPLYHIDDKAWEANKELITTHLKVWSPLHQKAVQRAMTDFAILTEDRLVQRTSFGADLQVIANFSASDFSYENQIVKAHSALVINGKETATFAAPNQ
ncbi:glycoside hydrolase [Brevibacillus centrosporus]|uniref:glycoside hydrolase n=1 Tax=Brevibacillus centrosporus TaxID=54910 RepID=UPI00380B038E